VITGSQVKNGGSNCRNSATVASCCESDPERKATSGPVSTIMLLTEAPHVLWVCRKVLRTTHSPAKVFNQIVSGRRGPAGRAPGRVFQGLPQNGRLRNPPRSGHRFERGVKLSRNLTGYRGHDRKIIPNCALGNTECRWYRLRLCKHCTARTRRRSCAGSSWLLPRVRCAQFQRAVVGNQDRCESGPRRDRFSGVRWKRFRPLEC
jgi:hypothetical protein